MSDKKKIDWIDFFVNAVFAAVPTFFLIVAVFLFVFPDYVNDVTMIVSMLVSIVVGIGAGVSSVVSHE